MKKELWEILPQRAREAHAIADFLGLPPLAASVLAAACFAAPTSAETAEDASNEEDEQTDAEETMQ